MIRTLQKFYEEFENNYPRLKVIGAVIHLDEATPHLHLDIIPYAEGEKKGLKHKVSFEKAIEQMGFTAEESLVNTEKKNPLIFNGFRNNSMRLLEDLMNNENLEREIKNNTKNHLEVKAFKEKMAIEDLKKSPEIIEKVKNEILNKMENKDELEEKIKFLENKKTSMEQELEELEKKHKKEKERLAEELEREKMLNSQRISEWQKETIESVQYKPSFWNGIKERVSKSRFIATLVLFKMEYDRRIPIPEILKDLKYFKKRFDFYNEKPERALEQQEIFENNYGITIYDHSQDINQDYENSKEDDFDMEM